MFDLNPILNKLACSEIAYLRDSTFSCLFRIDIHVSASNVLFSVYFVRSIRVDQTCFDARQLINRDSD